jgi:hypothetical protein
VSYPLIGQHHLLLKRYQPGITQARAYRTEYVQGKRE